MLLSEQLKLALDIHARSYKLLRWLTEAIRRGDIPMPRVNFSRHADDVTSATLDWIEPMHGAFPEEMRPQAPHIREFAAFFGTYITTSFDLKMDPGKILESQSASRCYCPICVRLVSASHLKAKKLTKSDKQRAERLMEDRIVDLAAEENIQIEYPQAKEILQNDDHRLAAAYSTYGYWLIERTKGITDGTSILALWREIAWNKLGSPKKDFQLRFDDFKASEESLVELFNAR